MLRPIKIAQIGTHHDHARQTYNSILKFPQVFDVIGVCEPSKTVNKNFADVDVKLTLDELLNMDDLEAVTIECEEENSTYYSQLFAEKGIAIHLDKPGSQNTESFVKLIDTVKSKSIPFQMGYMYRYNPLIIELMNEVKSGKLGEIFSIEAQMSVCHPLDKRKWLGKFKGGMMYFLGCHLIDLILQIQGIPKNIIPFNSSTETKLINGAEDFGFAILEYENGSSFVKTVANETNGFERRQFVVCGTKGTFEIKPFETKIGDSNSALVSKAHVTYSDNIKTDEGIWRDCSEEITSDCYDRYDPMMLDFAAFIRNEKENPYTYDYELELFKVLQKCCNYKGE